MKICLLNTYDQEGGAARACRRLYHGLSQQALEVQFLVRERTGDDASILTFACSMIGTLGALLDERMLHQYRQRERHNFSSARRLASAIRKASGLVPDVLHLHWVPKGFVRIEDLHDVAMPIVWTLHDSWPFTGGCHLPGACKGYRKECGACPVLGSDVENDLSRQVWQRKKKSYPLDRITIVAPSNWMAEKVRSSSLLRHCPVEIIPNALDTTLYSPGDKSAARETFGLPHDREIILFGAKSALTDPNKGADLFWQVIQSLDVDVRSRRTVVVFGEESDSFSAPVGLEVINLGVIADEKRIVDLYRAADVLVMTSRQENLPNMIAEAMSCGLPCVAFSVGGIPEQICHRKSGCLIEPFDVLAMSTELGWLLSSEAQRKNMSAWARADAERSYSLEKICRRHIALYEKVVNTVGRS